MTQKTPNRINLHVLALMIGLIIFGLILIGDISLIEAEVTFGDKFYLLKKQAVFALAGLSICFILANFNYQMLKGLSRPMFVASLIMLILVLIPSIGVKVSGARRWLDLGFTRIQPIELVKLASIIYFSHLSTREDRVPLWQQLAILSIPVGLTLLEPDFGSASLLVAGVGIVWFLSGENLFKLLSLVVIGLTIGGLLIFTSAYRRQRVMGLIDPFNDPQGKSYHVYQLVLTLGSGGLFGKGMGNSRQKYQYLPEATTDSIIALMAEEFGFVGVAIFSTVFVVFLLQCFKVARNAKDKFGQILSASLTGLIALQGIINLGAVAVVFPLTGMPFPFISYGGTSLLSLMAAVGLILSVSKNSQA